MLKHLLFFVALLASPMTGIATSALGHSVTITDNIWLLEYDNAVIEVTQTAENQNELRAYAELIYIADDLLHSIMLQASFIGLFILALIVLCIWKPRLLFQPFLLICFILCLLFAVHIYDQLATLRIHAENLRYYFLFFTT